MKKNNFTILVLMLGTVCMKAQVGVNTPNPTSTMDISAKNATGTTTNVDGLLVPRVDRQRAQSMTGVPTSTLIYVSSIATGAQAGIAANVDTVGYYYYNGTVWVKLASGGIDPRTVDNIYTNDGTLLANRKVIQDNKTLTFIGTQTNAFSVDGSSFSVDAANHRVGIGTANPANKLVIRGANAQPTNTNATVRVDGDGNHALDLGTLADAPYGTYINSKDKNSGGGLPLALNPAGGKVGVGTLAPETKFDVVTGTNGYGIQHTDGTIKVRSYVGAGGTNGNTNAGWLGTSSNHPLDLMTNDQARVRVDTNGNVGVGVTAPSNKLHVKSSADPLKLEGVGAGSKSDKSLVIDGNGVVKTIESTDDQAIPTPTVMMLNTSVNNFLNGVANGGSQTVSMQMMKNKIEGLTYTASSRTLNFPPGTYQITLVYEGTHDATNCTLSSYFFDFPNDNEPGGLARVHSTAGHSQGVNSNHGGTITYTVRLPNGANNVKVALGRGQSGNCNGAGMTLRAYSTHMLIFRLGS